MQFLIDQLLAKRKVLTLLTLLLGGVAATGIQHVTTDNSDDALLSEDDPNRAEVEQVRKDFPSSTAVLFAFLPASGDVFSLEVLHAMEDLTSRYSEVESAVSVGSLLNQRLNAVDADRLDRDYLIPDLSTLSQDDANDVRDIALADDLLTKTMLSPEGDMALAVIKYRATKDDQATRLSIGRSVVALRDSLRGAYPELPIYVIGGVLFELEGHNAQVKDSSFLFPLVIAASTLLLWFCLKSLFLSLCLFSLAAVTIGLTLGTIGWAQIPLNQISSMGPLVVFMIAMADGIHIVSIYLQGRHDSLGKIEAMRQSLAVNIQPVSLATVTTAMGFLSLNYCSSPAIYGFGNVVAIGVCWAYVVTLALLPTLVLLWPGREIPRPLGVRGPISLVGRLVAERGNALLAGSLVLIATTLALLPLNKLDFNQFSFVDEDSDFHQVMDALAEKIGNDQSLVYSIDSAEYYGITQPAFLNQVDEFSGWLEDQPEASFVTSYTDLLKTLNKAEHDNDESWNKLPEDHLQIIDYLVGYQLIQEIEPHLEPIFSSDYSAIRLVVGTSNLSNRELLGFNDTIEQWIAANLNPAYTVKHGDNSIVFARMNRSVSVELMQGFTLSFILITLTLLVGLKSVRYGLLSIVPNLFPATIVFGFWGLFVGELSPYVLMLFSISIGLVVDDSVHILSKYISARREGQPPESAAQYSLVKAGPAITITTLSLSLGTVILIFSSTFYFQNVAKLLTPIILVALLLDLLFLPPLLVKFDKWLDQRGRIRMKPAGGVT
jgi:predicted RND superfamily exporter protein